MVTRLGLYGGARLRYGSFEGKGAVVEIDVVTRLGLYGGARIPYGSFAGKAPGVPVTVPKFEGLRRNVGRMMR